jgi:hypothetical protein
MAMFAKRQRNAIYVIAFGDFGGGSCVSLRNRRQTNGVEETTALATGCSLFD